MKAIEKRYIPRLNMEVSFVGFGALEIGRDWGIGTGDAVKRPDADTAGRVLNLVLDSGITLIDTASAYHRSEERIGAFIGQRRAAYVLASKCGEHNNEPDTYYDFSYGAIKASIDNSLRLLQTNCIDIMQIHFGPDPHKVLDDGETVGAMKDAQREGKIRHLGASIDGDLAERCIRSGDFDVMQLEYNLLNTANRSNITLAEERGIGVFIRGGLAYGQLTPRVLPLLKDKPDEFGKVRQLLELAGGDGGRLTALALHFLYRSKGVSSVLVGTKNPDHLLANLRALETPFSEAALLAAERLAYEGQEVL